MQEEIVAKLKQIPIFQEFKDNNEYISCLHSIIKTKKVAQGQYIIREGEIGSEMYIVYKGKVEIRKKTRAGDNYTVIFLDAKDNIFFGEMALIDDEKRSASVLANTDCTFLVITKNDFLKLGATHPQICLPTLRAISKILAIRLRKTTQDMLTLFDALVNEIHT